MRQILPSVNESVFLSLRVHRPRNSRYFSTSGPPSVKQSVFLSLRLAPWAHGARGVKNGALPPCAGARSGSHAAPAVRGNPLSASSARALLQVGLRIGVSSRSYNNGGWRGPGQLGLGLRPRPRPGGATCSPPRLGRACVFLLCISPPSLDRPFSAQEAYGTAPEQDSHLIRRNHDSYDGDCNDNVESDHDDYNDNILRHGIDNCVKSHQS